MKTININLGQRSYPIYVGDNLLSNNKIFEKHIQTKKIAVVSNTTIAPLYLDIVISTLGIDKEIIPIILPDGEQYRYPE
jgi:3-dehydroquinate synthase